MGTEETFAELSKIEPTFDATYRGRPARYEIHIRHEAKPRGQKWFHEELIGDMNNLIGGRVMAPSFARFICYVEDTKDAEFLQMFFGGYIFGVLDWGTTQWIGLNGSGTIPDA